MHRLIIYDITSCMTWMPFYLTHPQFAIANILKLHISIRFVNALCYLLDSKCLTFLETVLLMHVDLIFQQS
jgi:hypothetical protein